MEISDRERFCWAQLSVRCIWDVARSVDKFDYLRSSIESGHGADVVLHGNQQVSSRNGFIECTRRSIDDCRGIDRVSYLVTMVLAP